MQLPTSLQPSRAPATAAPSLTPHGLRMVIPHTGRVTGPLREQLLQQRPVTVWLTGLSGAGKSTLAYALEEQLHELGFASFVLDGDNLRHRLNRDLGFSAAERTENIRRVAEVAALMNDAGLMVFTALISPQRSDRAMARALIGEHRFLEVHVSTPLDVCEGRDPKGLYTMARAGRIPHFTGVSAPYEPPESPDYCIDTALLDLPDACAQMLALLRQRGYIR
ncbi:adenylyl-sulfate kinase [Acidovorax sp. Q11]